MWKPGEEAVFVKTCGDRTEKHPHLVEGKIYIVKTVIGMGFCRFCGHVQGLRVFGGYYVNDPDSWDYGDCSANFRKPLVIEDEITLKVTENA